MPNKIKFFTPVSISNQEDKISCNSKLLTLGSCFSDNIGNKLENHLFDILVNPFGTIFNPFSISKLLELIATDQVIQASDLNFHENRYFHYGFHTSFDNIISENVIQQINKSIKDTRSQLIDADFLIITFGTSIVYKLKSNDDIVSNCHKVPNNNFKKEILAVNFMDNCMAEALEKIEVINPKLKIILTVSPVRHTKEGMVENSLSKSKLIELCHQQIRDHKNASYFPAYEIVIDELRDYRFYKSDLIHPNEQAIDIIWNRFMETYFDNKAYQKVKEINDLNLAKNHLPFDPNSKKHKIFKEKQLHKIGELKTKYPEVDFEPYIHFFTE